MNNKKSNVRVGVGVSVGVGITLLLCLRWFYKYYKQHQKLRHETLHAYRVVLLCHLNTGGCYGDIAFLGQLNTYEYIAEKQRFDRFCNNFKTEINLNCSDGYIDEDAGACDNITQFYTNDNNNNNNNNDICITFPQNVYQKIISDNNTKITVYGAGILQDNKLIYYKVFGRK